MIYTVKVFDRSSNEELFSQHVGVESLADFILQFSTKTNKIVILNDYYD